MHANGTTCLRAFHKRELSVEEAKCSLSCMCSFSYSRSVDRYGFYEIVDTEDGDALLTYSERLDEKSSDNMVYS